MCAALCMLAAPAIMMARSGRVPTLRATLPIPGDTVVVYGPRTFTTPNGSQTLNVERFTVTVQSDARYLLRIVNGDAGGTLRATSGSIAMNGATIVTSTELATGPQTILKEVAVTPTDTIAVTIAGAAGAHVVASVITTPSPMITIFGPKTYVRQGGNSSPASDNVTVPSGVGPPFTLFVDNGDSTGARRVSSATITVNGAVQLSSNDIKANVGSLTRALTLAGSNTFVVDIQSAPGNLLTARIVGLDVAPPAITIANPLPSALTKSTSVTVSGSVTDQTSVKLTVGGVVTPLSSGQYNATVPLPVEGDNVIHVIAVDAAGNSADSTRTVTRDTQAPTLAVVAPVSGFVTRFDTVQVRGSVSDLHAVTITANGVPIAVDPSGAFAGSVTLVDGSNFVTIVATDAAGNATTLTRSIIKDSAVPVLTLNGPLDGATTQQATTTVSGTVQDATTTTVRVNGTVIAVANGAFSTQIALTVGSNTITVSATDAAGNATTITRTVTRQSADGSLPPDPASVAPALNRTVATTIAGATAFLYTGANPIQTGVVAGTIDPTRAAVLRGTVKTRAGAALSGVTVSILQHAEFGQTISRADGAFDLAVNGGAPLVVNYAKSGYLPLQRQIPVPQQDYRSLPDVVLIPTDSASATIDFTAPIQVARGSTQTDAAGTRRATLLFAQGTHAAMTLANGTTQPLSSITARATEYTVGPNGPNAMPGPLPSTSAYTYAVELSSDEAISAGARELTFDKPVSFYVENFLNLPVGVHVPSGFYDRARAAWVPSADGRIVKIVDTAGGVASLSVVPSGAVADAATLASLGVSDAERQSLASLYSAGQTLWRVQVTHFSSWDYNFPGAPPEDAEAPDGNQPNDDDQDPCPEGGSIIECTTQVLGEELPVTGAPFNLSYRSNRVRGYASGFTQRIRVTGARVPGSLARVELTIEVAGKRISQSFSPAANQMFHFKWDGLDAYGRRLMGGQKLRYTIGYVYSMVYLLAPVQAATFGLTCPGSPNATGTTPCWLAPPIDAPVREVTLPTTYETTIGGIDGFTGGLGGWTPTIQHMYDQAGRVLYEGGGRRRSADILGGTAVLAGTGTFGFSGDGGPATAAMFNGIADIKAAPDGSVYIADRGNRRIRRVDKSGIITTFAGTGADGNAGDGGPAAQAQLYPEALAIGPEGSVYVSTTDRTGSRGPRIKRISPSGIITTIAGDGQRCLDYDLPSRCGDDGPATQAQFYPIAFDVGPDGTIWVSDGAFVLRRIGPDGIVHRVTGDTLGDFCGYGQPISSHNPDPTCGENKLAGQGRFDGLYDVRSAPDGSIVLADGGNGIIWRIGTDGLFRRVAGSRVPGETVHFAGDGGPATLARFNDIESIVVASDGTLFIADNQNGRVRRVGTNGVITTVAGSGFAAPCCAAGGLPLQLSMSPTALTIAPDGALYVADENKNRVFTLSGVSQNRVASEDGSEIYEFDATGRHLRTLDGLTGRPSFTFGYSPAGTLVSVTDSDGSVTQLERNGAGKVSAIVSPFGQRTTVGLDANGYLATLTNPANETIRFQHDSLGLLRSMTDASNNPPHLFVYDSIGRLTRDTDPSGGYKTLVRQLSDTGMTATATTALGRVVTHSLLRLSTGDDRRVDIGTAGAVTTTDERKNGTTTITQADGTVSSTTIGPDPRFGMAAPITAQFSVAFPSGLTVSGRSSRVSTLSNPFDPTTLTTQIDSTIVNGAISRTIFNAAARTVTEISAEGRQFVAVLDTAGRVVEERAPGEAPVKYAYGARSLLTSITQAGRTVRYDYDSAGRVKAMTDPLGRVERLAYDSVGRPLTQTLPNLTTILYSYDANGNLASLTPPGQPAHTFLYTSSGLDSIYTPPSVGLAPPSTRFAYDLDGQLTQLTRPDSLAVQLRYDAAGRLDTLILPTGRIRFGYGAQSGQLMSMSGASGSPTATLGFTYDGSLPKTTVWSGVIAGNVAAGYDGNLRLNTLSVNGANPVSVAYDRDNLLISAGSLGIARQAASGRVTGTTLGSMTSVVEADDSLMTLSRLTYAYGATTVFDASYVRDSIGRIVQVAETVLGATATRSFVYDSIGRLRQVRVGGTTVADYGYDANGNRTSLVTSGGSVAGAFDAQDRLLSYGANVYSYSSNGELVRKVSGGDTTRYVYDVAGNLLQVRLGSGMTFDYLVDPLNRRIGRKVNGTLTRGFLYQSRLAPIAELDGSNQVVSRFVYGTRENVPDYMVKGGVTYRLVTDHLGSVRLVVDAATGVVAQRLDYDEFGRVTQNTNPDFQPFGYAGGIYDAATGLVRFGARDYDAETGRWTIKDPVGLAGGSSNLYAYAYEDPINEVDASGLQATAAPGFWESMIPIWGPVKQSAHDFDCGRNFWGAVNLGLGVLDAATGASAIEGVARGAWKTGGTSWRRVSEWMRQTRDIPAGVEIHHWLIERNSAIGKLVPDWIKNQPWNLNWEIGNQTHALYHGNVAGLGRNPLGPFGRAWYGPPTWAKTSAASAAGHSADAIRGRSPCGC